MADVELIIKISHSLYDKLIDMDIDSDTCSFNESALVESIQNGTPLPKGHGRLVDADYLRDVALLHNWHGNDKNYVPYSDRKGYRLREREVDEAILNAPTIIEADRTEREDSTRTLQEGQERE